MLMRTEPTMPALPSVACAWMAIDFVRRGRYRYRAYRCDGSWLIERRRDGTVLSRTVFFAARDFEKSLVGIRKTNDEGGSR